MNETTTSYDKVESAEWDVVIFDEACIKMNKTTTSYENKYKRQLLLPFLILVKVAGEYLFGHNFDK